MTAVGNINPNFPVPVCSSFEPFLLNDQVYYFMFYECLIHSAYLLIHDQNDVQNCYKLDINKYAKNVEKKDMMDHGLRFVMDYNKDRWGFQSRDDDTTDEGKVTTTDVLKNKNWDNVQKGDNAVIYFQNIGMA